MTEALRPGEDAQATSSRASRRVRRRSDRAGAAGPDPGTPGHRRGGLAPVPNDSERTQAGTRRAGSP